MLSTAQETRVSRNVCSEERQVRVRSHASPEKDFCQFCEMLFHFTNKYFDKHPRPQGAFSFR